jgi:hypothetical protein
MAAAVGDSAENAQETIVTSGDLIGLGLSEAFRKLVLEDPEVIRLSKELVAQTGRWSAIFESGQYPAPFGGYKWPVDITDEDLAHEFVREVMIFPNTPSPQPSQRMREVARALVRKLDVLRDWLVGGELIAWGTFVRSGAFGPIHRMQWRRSGIEIDVRDGDLFEAVDDKMAVTWSGLILEAPQNATSGVLREPPTAPSDAPETFHGKSSEHAAVRSRSMAPPRLTAQRASIDAAVAALWPNGIPTELSVQARDQKIIEWQKARQFSVASSKTIARHLKRPT